MESFKNYLEHFQPLPWTVIQEHPSKYLVGNNDLVINYKRVNLIMDAVRKHFLPGNVVLDIGVYPGNMPQIFHEYYPKNEDYTYYGVGLGFDEDFIEAMQGFNVELLECDLDPRLHLNGKLMANIPLDDESIDLTIFTDVIEHFYDPFYPLQEINRVSKLGAIMILTTDNLTRFGSQLALLRGKSCNVPLINGNLFFEGDWRPHFREYSRGELFQLLQWSGFEVISHKFYGSNFGYYRLVDGILRKHFQRHINLKGKVVDILNRFTVKLVPYTRDNHILVVRKKLEYDEMMERAPKIVKDRDKWLNQRKFYHSHKSA